MNITPLDSRPAGTEDGPTDAELDAIEAEMPLISAELELLDAQIITLDRAPNELDARRLRRAHRRVLAERVELANRAATPRRWRDGTP